MPHRDYSHQDFRNQSFESQDLTGADFRYSNLNGCNFSSAVLTEANFQGCRTGQRERKPASGTFQPGDFEKLVHQFAKTLDFLFRNGIEPQAFDFALKNLLIDYEDAGLSMHSVVDVGGGDRLVRFSRANPNVDPGAMHTQFSEDYVFMQLQLGEAQEQNQLLEKDLAHVIRTNRDLRKTRHTLVDCPGKIDNFNSRFTNRRSYG